MYSKSCKSCGKDVVVIDKSGNRINKVDTQFCSTQCKNDFHNDMRKAQRKIDSINRALDELHAIDQKYGHSIEFSFIRKKVQFLLVRIKLF